MIHELKCWPGFFSDLLSGAKTFELRYNDRDFRAGDDLILKEWSPQEGYTSRKAKFHVSHILLQGFGLKQDWVCMSIIPCPASDKEHIHSFPSDGAACTICGLTVSQLIIESRRAGWHECNAEDLRKFEQYEKQIAAEREKALTT